MQIDYQILVRKRLVILGTQNYPVICKITLVTFLDNQIVSKIIVNVLCNLFFEVDK